MNPGVWKWTRRRPEGLVLKFDPFPAYREHLEHLIDFEAIRRARLHVAVDAMYGAGRGYMCKLLTEAGAEVTEIRGEMNPGFNGIHPEPIAKHLKPLIDLIQAGKFHLGLATDGDADRIGAVGPTGRFIDPHCIMTLALRYLVEVRGWRGAVVKTVSTTQMLNRLAEQLRSRPARDACRVQLHRRSDDDGGCADRRRGIGRHQHQRPHTGR